MLTVRQTTSRSRLLRLGGRAIVIMRFDLVPKDHQHAFGVGVEMLTRQIYEAWTFGAALYVVRPPRPVNGAIYLLRSPDVRILSPSPRGDRAAIALWRLTDPLARLDAHIERARRRLHELNGAVRRRARGAGGPKWLRARRKQAAAVAGWAVSELDSLLGRLSVGGSEPPRAIVRPLMASGQIRVLLPRRVEAEARRQASQLGLDSGPPIVTLHVREAGWYRGFGMEENPAEWARSADVQTYRRAVDELVCRGYRVVRMGDPSMAPIDWPGFVDLATSPARTDLLELWCVARSAFFIGCESGPGELAKLLGVPILLVNVRGPDRQYPPRRTDRYILKRMVRLADEHVLSLREQASPRALADRNRFDLIRYRDNTDEEILRATIEMLDALGGDSPESDAQAEFRRTLERSLSDPTLPKKYRRRGLVGSGPVFLGAGSICRFFAERYLDSGAGTLVSAPLGEGAG